MEICQQNLLRLTALEWYSFQLQESANYSSRRLTLPCEKQTEYIDEIV